MTIAVKAHFDGKVIVPDEPVDLQPGQPLIVRIEPSPESGTAAATAERLADSPLKEIWDEIAAGEDSTIVARRLREQAQRRDHP